MCVPQDLLTASKGISHDHLDDYLGNVQRFARGARCLVGCTLPARLLHESQLDAPTCRGADGAK